MKVKKSQTEIQPSSCSIVARDIKNNRIKVEGKGILIDPRDATVEAEVEDEIIQLEGYQFAKYAQIK